MMDEIVEVTTLIEGYSILEFHPVLLRMLERLQALSVLLSVGAEEQAAEVAAMAFHDADLYLETWSEMLPDFASPVSRWWLDSIRHTTWQVEFNLRGDLASLMPHHHRPVWIGI